MWINSFVGRQTFTGLPLCVPLRPRCEATNAKAPKGASVEAGSLCSSVRGPCRGSSWPVGGRGWGHPPEGLRGAGPPGPARVLPATEGNRACDMQGLLWGRVDGMSQPLADGWPDGWPSSSQPQESGKARSKAGPHKAARLRGAGCSSLLPSLRRPGVCVQGLLRGTSPSPHPHPCRLVRNQKRLHPAARGNGGRPLDFRQRSEST